jgi:hypothetical protein
MIPFPDFLIFRPPAMIPFPDFSIFRPPAGDIPGSGEQYCCGSEK